MLRLQAEFWKESSRKQLLALSSKEKPQLHVVPQVRARPLGANLGASAAIKRPRFCFSWELEHFRFYCSRILGGVALQRCDKFIVLTAALAAEVINFAAPLIRKMV